MVVYSARCLLSSSFGLGGRSRWRVRETTLSSSAGAALDFASDFVVALVDGVLGAAVG